MHATGRVLLVAGNDAPDDSPVDEAKTFMAAFVDPTRPDAERRVRIETLSGVGDKAVAILELKDPAKGLHKTVRSWWFDAGNGKSYCLRFLLETLRAVSVRTR